MTGGSRPYFAGRRGEYQLMEALKRNSWYVIRGPASGRTSRRFFYPDIIAIKKGKILLIECKVRSGRRGIFLEKGKARMLLWAAEITGGVALLAVRYRGLGGFRFVRADEPQRETDKYLSWSRSWIEEHGVRVEEVERLC